MQDIKLAGELGQTGMMCKRSLFVLAMAVAVVEVTCSVCVADPSPTIENLTALLTKRDQELHALAAVYRQVSRETQNDGVVGGYIRRSVAFRPPAWFFRDNAHGHSGLDWRQDPLRKTLLIRPGETLLLENLNRVVLDPRFAPDESAPRDVQTELLFLVLCWWPYSDWPSPDFAGRSWSMSSLLADGGYSLRQEITLLGGRRCVIIEKPEIDVLWLDASPPHCVLRREVFNHETGALGWRCDYGSHMHHGGNIWLPRTFTSQHFDSYASSKETQRRLVIDAKFEMTDVRVNAEVVDEDFQLELLPGTVRREVPDEIEHLIPVRDGQREHAKAMTNWAAAIGVQGQQASSSIRGFGEIAAWSAVGLLAGLGLGLLSAFVRPMVELLHAARSRNQPSVTRPSGTSHQ